MSAESIHVKRVPCEYTLLEQRIIDLNKEIILAQMKVLTLTKVLIIYENQEIIACKVISVFKNRKIINAMVVGKTQSGKTGMMCATIKKYLEDAANLIPIDNIYIITGLSSCEWKEQTIKRLPESVQSRVFHRCDLPNTFVDEIKDKKNTNKLKNKKNKKIKKSKTQKQKK